MKIIHTSLTQHGKLPENLPFDSLAPITGPFAHLHITRKTGLQKEGNRGKAGDVDHVARFFRRIRQPWAGARFAHRRAAGVWSQWLSVPRLLPWHTAALCANRSRNGQKKKPSHRVRQPFTLAATQVHAYIIPWRCQFFTSPKKKSATSYFPFFWK